MNRSPTLLNSKAKHERMHKNFSGVDYDDFHLLFYDDFSNDKNEMEKIAWKTRGKLFLLFSS